MSDSSRISSLMLRKQLNDLKKNPVQGFSAGLINDDDLFRWEVIIIGPPNSLYEGGLFKVHIYFTEDYPLRAPRVKFLSEIWHPKIETNGDVCVSVFNEQSSEEWAPVTTVEIILIHLMSMLLDPNDDAPVNIEAAKEWKEAYPDFKLKVKNCVRKSQEECI